MTLRDRVWDSVLKELTADDGAGFKSSDLDFDESKRHTVRRVLREMENLDWLERNDDNARIWYAGERAKLLLRHAEDIEPPEGDN